MDPYLTSQFNEKKPQLSTTSKVWISIISFFSGAFYFSIYQSVPGFVDVFAGFGMENSLIIDWLFTYYVIFLPLSLLSFLPLVIWIQHPLVVKKQNVIKYIAIHNIVISCLVLIIVQVALYQPILEIGKAV